MFMSQPRTLEKHSSPTHDPFSTNFPRLDPADCHSTSRIALTVVWSAVVCSSDIMTNRAAGAAVRAVARWRRRRRRDGDGVGDDGGGHGDCGRGRAYIFCSCTSFVQCVCFCATLCSFVPCISQSGTLKSTQPAHRARAAGAGSPAGSLARASEPRNAYDLVLSGTTVPIRTAAYCTLCTRLQEFHVTLAQHLHGACSAFSLRPPILA